MSWPGRVEGGETQLPLVRTERSSGIRTLYDCQAAGLLTSSLQEHCRRPDRRG